MTSVATRLAAVDMGGNAVYSDLKPGDLFYFPTKRGGAKLIYEKGFGGWYTRVASTHLAYPRPKFRTGSGTTVVKLGAK